ncbi:sigma-70 family RNA polymerase sigma factor [Zavarzinella formosa]|uniref:sigma-70 family RNA polymerase sigma factor n=1 Tax=Zavarzinella formosa TaxID=360055 RepID=UPI0004982983|nr:sigma-70 family RNA polymerase sigma factor [Zavarzinella formosa]
MKQLMSPGGSRRLMAAVVMGTALSAMAGEAMASQPAPDAVHDISRYCQVCWRNARLHPDSWSDCTQEVLIRLLQTVEAEKWPQLLKLESDDRREFIRAIDAVKKRTQRAKKYQILSDEVPDRRMTPDSSRNEIQEELELASGKVLSQRQQRILQLTRDGWTVPEIATDMNTTVERISDEKYKAIRKLRKELNG